MNIGFQKNSKPKKKEKKKRNFFLDKKKKPTADKEVTSDLHKEVWQQSVDLNNTSIDGFLTNDSSNEEDNFFDLENIDNSMGEQIALDLQMPGTEARDFSSVDDFDSEFPIEDLTVSGETLADDSNSAVDEEQTLANTDDLTMDYADELELENDSENYEDFSIDFSVLDDTDGFEVDTTEDYEVEDTYKEEKSLTQDDYADYSVLTDSDLESTTKSDNDAFVHIEAGGNDVINDVEYEALLELFSTLTREEVDALPPNYRKLFDQNFKPNETYVGDSENDSIRKKLGIKDLDLREIDNNIHLTQEEITATLNGVELPVSVIQKLLPEGKTLEEPENMEGIKAKILSSFEPTFSNQLEVTSDSSEVPLIAVNYCNDDVPDVVQLEDGLLGVLPYKVFRQGELLKADSNYEITLGKDDVVLVRTGIKYIATPNCTVRLDGPDASTGLVMLGFNVSPDSIDLQLKAEKNTYINKNSILCKINYKEI